MQYRTPLGDRRAVARATASQYDKEQIEIVRIPYIDSESQIDEINSRCKNVVIMLICHTISI